MRLFELINAGLFSGDKLERLLLDWPQREFHRLTSYTLDEYQGLINAQEAGIFEMLRYSIGVEKGISEKKTKRYVTRMSIDEALSRLAFLRREIRRVQAEFDSIPKLPLSFDVENVLSKKKNYGVYGIIDMIAKRQSLTDEEAGKTKLIFAIVKMKIDAQIAIAEAEIKNIQLSKMRAKKKR